MASRILMHTSKIQSLLSSHLKGQDNGKSQNSKKTELISDQKAIQGIIEGRTPKDVVKKLQDPR